MFLILNNRTSCLFVCVILFHSNSSSFWTLIRISFLFFLSDTWCLTKTPPIWYTPSFLKSIRSGTNSFLSSTSGGVPNTFLSSLFEWKVGRGGVEFGCCVRSFRFDDFYIIFLCDFNQKCVCDFVQNSRPWNLFVCAIRPLEIHRKMIWLLFSVPLLNTKIWERERRNGDLNERCLLRFPEAFFSVSREWNVFACVCCWIEEKGSMSSANLHFFFFFFSSILIKTHGTHRCVNVTYTPGLCCCLSWVVAAINFPFFLILILSLSPPWASQSTKKISSLCERHTHFVCVCVCLFLVFVRRPEGIKLF